MYYNNEVIIISNVLANKENWQVTYDFFLKKMQDGFEDDDVMTSTVLFKFHPMSSQTYSLYLSGFILNMALWKPFVFINKKVNTLMETWDERHMLNPENLNKRALITKINDLVVKPYRRVITNKDMNRIAYSITKCWKDLAEDFGPLLAISINIYDEIMLCKNDPEYHDLLHTNLPEDMQAKEMENYIRERTDRVISKIKADENHCLSPILISGEGIKPKQFKEYSTCVGTKPDGQGGIHKLPVNTSFIRGHRKVSDYFIDGTSGRIAQIIQRRNVSSSGAFARQLGLLTVEVKLHADRHHDCGSKHRTEFEIKTMEHLKLINGLYICDMQHKGNEANHEYLLDLDEKDYTNLVGRTVMLRSPITCASKEICHKCYGDLAYTNSDINIGLFAATELTEKLTQTMLSAKHLLESKAKEIAFNLLIGEDTSPLIDSVKDIIFIQMDNIKLNDENYDTLCKFTLIVGEDDLVIEEVDSEFKEENETKIYMNSFKFVDTQGGSYEVTCSNPMYISDELAEMIKDNVTEDGFSEVLLADFFNQDGASLACIALENNEISKTFNELKSVIGSEKSVADHDRHSMFNAFADVLINAEFGLMLVHAAVIMRPLVRSRYDVLKYPNWQLTDYRADYTLLGLQRAVMKDPSLVVSLAFERLKNQFIDPTTFEKNQASTYDVLFSETY